MKPFPLILLLAIGIISGCKVRNDALHLSTDERAEIISESCKALSAFVQIEPADRDGNNIPKRLWGVAILRLKPLRVTDDRLHIRIVLRETDRFEEGLFVSNPVSSYLPPPNEFLELVTLGKPDEKTFGTLYRYRSIKIKAR